MAKKKKKRVSVTIPFPKQGVGHMGNDLIVFLYTMPFALEIINEYFMYFKYNFLNSCKWEPRLLKATT